MRSSFQPAGKLTTEAKMGRWRVLVFDLTNDERGAALAEWGLLVVLIAIIGMVALTAAGAEVSQTYSEISTEVANAGS